VFICPECRSVYHEPLKRCERDQEPLVPVQANQNVRTYPLLNQELDGRYHLIGGLGQGGVGTVYLANHIHLDQLSAVKFLDVDQLGQADEEQREETLSDFVKEAKLAMLLRHDSVVRVMDYGVFERSPFLVMEYIPGPSLLRQINSGQRFSVEQCLNVIRKLADALNAFHERKLVHRDLKPANVIVDPRDNGQLTLVDLGLVKDLSTEARSSTHPLALRGTPGYLAPEQVPSWVLSSAGVPTSGDKKRIDSRVDIYALGVLAYELLSGQPPYPKGLSATKVIIHACTQEPTPIESLRPDLTDYPGLAQLVKSMMSKSPEDRPLDGKEVMQRVDEILEDGQDPLALREELERAQSALKRRMSAQSGGVSLSPQLPNRPSATGALLAPPPSMTGSHRAIELDGVDGLINSPRLSSPQPIQGVEPQAPPLAPPPVSPLSNPVVKRHEQAEEYGVETLSEDDVLSAAPSTHDSFNEQVATEFTDFSSGKAQPGRAHFQGDERTYASERPSADHASSNFKLWGMIAVALIASVGIAWQLSSPDGPQDQAISASVQAIPVPSQALAPARRERSLPHPSQQSAAQSYQPRVIGAPTGSSPVLIPQPSVRERRGQRSSPQAEREELTDRPVQGEPPQAARARSEKSVNAPPAQRQRTKQTKQPKRTKQARQTKRKSARDRRRAKKTESNRVESTKREPRELSPKQIKALMMQVDADRRKGDLDRARSRVYKEMQRVDPNSPQYQDLKLLWEDIQR